MKLCRFQLEHDIGECAVLLCRAVQSAEQSVADGFCDVIEDAKHRVQMFCATAISFATNA
jgi:hypothetical protein